MPLAVKISTKAAVLEAGEGARRRGGWAQCEGWMDRQLGTGPAKGILFSTSLLLDEGRGPVSYLVSGLPSMAKLHTALKPHMVIAHWGLGTSRGMGFPSHSSHRSLPVLI